MRRVAGLMIVLVACTEAPELSNAPEGPTGPAPVGTMNPSPPYLEGAFAEALAAREQPEIVLPAQPVTRIGRCAVELGPRPEEARALLLAALTARNGAGWDQGVDFAHSGSGWVWSAGLRIDVDQYVSVSDAEALAQATSFVVTNYDLFGLTEHDVATGRVRVGGEDSGHYTAIARTVELRGREPVVSTDAPAWRGAVDFGWDGHVRQMLVRSDELMPDVELCDAPLLSPSDPRVVASVLGYDLSYGDGQGGIVHAGAVVARDLGAITLIERRDRPTSAGSTVIRLVYKVPVNRQGDPWSFYVDPDTGELVAVDKDFIVN